MKQIGIFSEGEWLERLQSIGLERAEYAITLKNLAYNMKRYVFLSQPPPLGQA